MSVDKFQVEIDARSEIQTHGRQLAGIDTCPDCQSKELWTIVGALNLEKYCRNCYYLCDCGLRYRRAKHQTCPVCEMPRSAKSDAQRVAEWTEQYHKGTGDIPAILENFGRIGPAGRSAIPLLKELYRKEGKTGALGCLAYDTLRELEQYNQDRIGTSTSKMTSVETKNVENDPRISKQATDAGPSSDNRIHFSCPHCCRSFSVARIHAGRQGNCPKCNGIIHIPRADKLSDKSMPVAPEAFLQTVKAGSVAETTLAISKVGALLDNLVRAHEKSRNVPGSEALDYVFEGLSVSCPACGPFSQNAVATLALSNKSFMQGAIFGGPNAAALMQGRCPSCGGGSANVKYDPRCNVMPKASLVASTSLVQATVAKEQGHAKENDCIRCKRCSATVQLNRPDPISFARICMQSVLATFTSRKNVHLSPCRCPKCGYLPADMVSSIREFAKAKLYALLLSIIGIFIWCAAAIVIMALFATNTLTYFTVIFVIVMTIVVGGSALILVLGHSYVSRLAEKWDPNDPDKYWLRLARLISADEENYARGYTARNNSGVLICLARRWGNMRKDFLVMLSDKLQGDIKSLQLLTGKQAAIAKTWEDLCVSARNANEACTLFAIALSINDTYCVEYFLDEMNASDGNDRILPEVIRKILKDNCAYARAAVKIDPLVYLAYEYLARYSDGYDPECLVCTSKASILDKYVREMKNAVLSLSNLSPDLVSKNYGYALLKEPFINNLDDLDEYDWLKRKFRIRTYATEVIADKLKREGDSTRRQADRPPRKDSGHDPLGRLDDNQKRSLLELGRGYLMYAQCSRIPGSNALDLTPDDPAKALVAKLSERQLEWLVDIANIEQEATNAGNSGDHAKAIALYEIVVAKAPWNSIALMSLGVQHAYMKHGKKAIEYLEQAAQIDPANSRILENLEAIRRDFGKSGMDR